MNNRVVWNGIVYTMTETFDVNITVDYENNRWSAWHVMREFISNALDAVSGDTTQVEISVVDDEVHIRDRGPGYPLAYAKRIGASSKKAGGNTIGQFGEGVKLALLTCVRRGISVRLLSQNWCIVPRVQPDSAGLDVLLFDIYHCEECIAGTVLTIAAELDILAIVNDIGHYFLQFRTASPLAGTLCNGIYAKSDVPCVYNKGVYVRNIDALYSYALSLGELNRDRDLIDENTLVVAITDVWRQVYSPNLIKTYLQESERIATTNNPSRPKEYSQTIYPRYDLMDVWRQVFVQAYGEKAVLYTDPRAALEACHLGYAVVQMEYCAKATMQYVGIQRDVDVLVNNDYEFDWASFEALNDAERNRMEFLVKVGEMLDLPSPRLIRVFERYAKSDLVLGMCNGDAKEVYIARKHLLDDMEELLGTYLHELTHLKSGYDDYSREFANSLTQVAGSVALRLVREVGIPITLRLTDRGFKLPRSLAFSAGDMMGSIATVGDEVVIHLPNSILRTRIKGARLRPYCSNRHITYYKGDFFVNLPSCIRSVLPDETTFNMVKSQISTQL